jgi:hypothetical protein
MEFQHPELRKYYEDMRRLMEASGVQGSGESETIYQLMAMVDRFRIAEWNSGGSLPEQGDSNWSPISPELTEVIQHILSLEQREPLREWFKDPAELNPTASAFRDWLEARIGESLKHNKSAHPTAGNVPL